MVDSIRLHQAALVSAAKHSMALFLVNPEARVPTQDVGLSATLKSTHSACREHPCLAYDKSKITARKGSRMSAAMRDYPSKRRFLRLILIPRDVRVRTDREMSFPVSTVQPAQVDKARLQPR